MRRNNILTSSQGYGGKFMIAWLVIWHITNKMREGERGGGGIYIYQSFKFSVWTF